MKEFNKEEYNKMCAEFLGYINLTPDDKDFDFYEHPTQPLIIDKCIFKMLEPKSMLFHSDWNWIMEIVEKIKSINLKLSVEYDEVMTLFITTPKQIVVQVIWEFLNWYNENKKYGI